MKKIISMILALTMVAGMSLVLSACGEKEITSETVTDYTYELGEGVPNYTLEGEWIPVEEAESDEYTALGTYTYAGDVADLDGIKTVGVYEMEKNAPLLESAKAILEYDSPEQAEDIQIVESDKWEEEGDYHFAHFTTFDEETYGEPMYCSSYIFDAGDKIIQYCYWAVTEKVVIDDVLSMYMPYNFEMKECDIPELEDTYLVGYESPTEEFANVGFFKWEGEESVHDYIDKYRESYDLVDSAEYKTALGESGTEYDCAYVKFKEKTGDESFLNVDYITKIGDTFFEINFFQDADEEEYQVSTYGAMLWALTETGK